MYISLGKYRNDWMAIVNEANVPLRLLDSCRWSEYLLFDYCANNSSL